LETFTECPPFKVIIKQEEAMTNQECVQPGVKTTGRFIVTFREGAQSEALASLRKGAGLTKAKLMSSADFGEKGVDIAQVPKGGGVVLERLGIAVASMDEAAAGLLAQEVGEDAAILAIEPEGIMHALGQTGGLSVEYLRGFRDAADTLYAQAGQTVAEKGLAEAAAAFDDTDVVTWGLQATKVETSRFSGKGIRVAVLDTGLDLKHPDFAGRTIVSKSFLNCVATAQDGHGHGTHCTGTACGPLKPAQGRRYGVAYGSEIFVGKVLSDQLMGDDIGVLSGIDWAVSNKCHVISMSLGASICRTSTAYETAGQRAMNAGTLIVAAAGNTSRRSSGVYGCVNRPANSRSFMAVGEVDCNLGVGNSSCRDTVQAAGTAVDIAGPGVNAYSAWLMPVRKKIISGTSAATPHVAGIAALWAQAMACRGAVLWYRLITNARTLSAPFVDVGRGLVQAP
jgi:subtilisin family serine protease